MQHLARVASHSGDTGMTAKNIAIVWAPNLLRSKDLDMGGVAALQVSYFLGCIPILMIMHCKILHMKESVGYYQKTEGYRNKIKYYC